MLSFGGGGKDNTRCARRVGRGSPLLAREAIGQTIQRWREAGKHDPEARITFFLGRRKTYCRIHPKVIAAGHVTGGASIIPGKGTVQKQ